LRFREPSKRVYWATQVYRQIAWLLHTETVRGVAPSTLSGYRVMVGRLYVEFPA
jgi:hypothetical protein